MGFSSGKVPFALLNCLVALQLASQCVATSVDFTTFTPESFPHADNNSNTATDIYPIADWMVSTASATATHIPNATPSVFFSPWDVMNKRISGTLNGVDDDDPIGIVLGFEPGDATLGSQSSVDADYLLLDWKRLTQMNNFADYAVPGFTPFHNLTGLTTSTEGLVLSRVRGVPTADELWGRNDLDENMRGGVTELTRGETLGTTGFTANTSYVLSVEYTMTRLIVAVDGIKQFEIIGTFPSGRFGLYSNIHGATSGPLFSDFSVTDLAVGDFDSDLDVDGADFLVWQQELGLIGPLMADGDHDLDVDQEDLNLWRGSFGIVDGSTFEAFIVPEPSSKICWLIMPALLFAMSQAHGSKTLETGVQRQRSNRFLL